MNIDHRAIQEAVEAMNAAQAKFRKAEEEAQKVLDAEMAEPVAFMRSVLEANGKAAYEIAEKSGRVPRGYDGLPLDYSSMGVTLSGICFVWSHEGYPKTDIVVSWSELEGQPQPH